MTTVLTEALHATAPYLFAAAETARRLGPHSQVQLVTPRKPGLVFQARVIAEEHGVQLEVLQIDERSVQLRFFMEPASEPAPITVSLGTQLKQALLRLGGWLRSQNVFATVDEPRVDTGAGFTAPAHLAEQMDREVKDWEETRQPFTDELSYQIAGLYMADHVRKLHYAIRDWLRRSAAPCSVLDNWD